MVSEVKILETIEDEPSKVKINNSVFKFMTQGKGFDSDGCKKCIFRDSNFSEHCSFIGDLCVIENVTVSRGFWVLLEN